MFFDASKMGAKPAGALADMFQRLASMFHGEKKSTNNVA